MNKLNQKRLLNDVVDIMKNPLDDNNIFYSHDENDMLKGYALVIGPDDTLYSNGYYLFEFNFPKDYPYTPPKLKYLTNNGHTRFHPNLYRTGKVCLSILNTWRGEQWTSCQTIRSVLVTLVTLFHNKPLLNEPGLTEQYKDFKKYNEIIQFENYNTAIIGVLNDKVSVYHKKMFEVIINEKFKKKKEKIKKKIDELNKKNKKSKIKIGIYNQMTSYVDYEKIQKAFDECDKKIN